MSLLQIKIDDNLKKAIKQKADEYGVPSSSIVRIVLIKSFLNDDRGMVKGNIFNAERDNKGIGIDIDDFIERL